MSDMGKTIQILRQARGVAMTDLAQRAGVSVAYLSLIESGKREPSLDVAKRISSALNVPNDLLLLLGSSSSSTLRSDDERVTRMISAVRKLEEAERLLRESMVGDDHAE